MNITSSLLYLLLLYAVLDKDNKLSLNLGLIIAFVILLVNCYVRNRCCGSSSSSTSTTTGGNAFSSLNGF